MAYLKSWALGEKVLASDLNANFTALQLARAVTFVATETIATNAAVAPTLYQSSQIGIDTFGTAASTSSSITIAANSNRVLILAVMGAGSSGTGTNPAITWNGAGQTIANHGDFVGAGNNHYEISYSVVIAPVTGTHTFSVTSTWGTSRIWWWSLYNCAQSATGLNTAFNGVQGGTALSISGTAVNNGSLFLGFMGSFGAAAPVSPSGNVYNANAATGTSTGYAKADSGVSTIIPLGTTMTLAHTGSASTNYVSQIIEIVPFAAPVDAVQNASSAAVNTRLPCIGFANAGSTVGANIDVIVEGVVTGFTGLLSGATYYLNDTNGTIGQVAGSQSRKIGIAISSTKLLMSLIL